MTSEVASVPELVGSNYLAWKRKMIDVLRSQNLWRLVNGEHKTPTTDDDLAICIRGNLGSKMGLIRKRAKISFCELEFKNQ